MFETFEDWYEGRTHADLGSNVSADPTSIERIRSASFETARRGYKKQDVDRFLASLADWLESGAGQEKSTVVKEALADVGKRTSSILVTAEESAQEIRDKAQKELADAEANAKQTRERTEEQAKALKESSEAEAERIRSVAARDAEETVSKAKADVRAVVAEGDARKEAIEAEIEKLTERRDAFLERIDELASQLTGTAKQHRPAETGRAEAETEVAETEAGGNGERKPPAKPGAKAPKASARA